MSVEAIGSTSIKASETKLPTMSKVNINVQKTQAATKLSQGINTDPGVSKAMTALPSLEAISTQVSESNQVKSTERTDRAEWTDRAERTDRAEQTSETKQTVQNNQQEQKYREVMAEKAVENANNRVRATKTNARFEYNEDIKRITITIMDENQEVVKEIPPEETQKMLERLHTFTGMMMDQDI